MMNSLPLGKTVAAAALAALTLGSGLTMTAGEAQARDGRKGAIIAAGVLGALAVGAIAAQAEENRRSQYYVDDGYAGHGRYAPAYQEPVQYHPGYYHHPGYGHRHHRRYHGYSETGYVYRGPVCKIRKQQVWDGYGWTVQRVQVCR